MKVGYLSLGENRFSGVERSDRQYYQDYLSLVEALDKLDYNSFWTGEHHFAHVAVISSPMSVLSAMAARTERIRLATAVNVMSFHHPIRYAEDHATLDLISGGRAQVGAGVGYARGEFDAFGRNLDRAREYMHEALPIAVEALNTGHFPAVENDLFTVGAQELVPRPIQHPFPVYVALTGSWSTIDWAAERGYHLVTGSQAPAVTGQSLPKSIAHYQRVRAENGHGLGKVSVPFFTIVSRDQEQIGQEFHHMVNYWKGLSHDLAPGMPNDLAYWDTLKTKFEELTVEDLRNRQTAFGTPEQLVELFLQVAASGADEVLIEPFYGPQSLEEALRNAKMFRDEVMPYIDERFGGPKYGWDGEKFVLEREAVNQLPGIPTPPPAEV